jgi:hypothetical protein
MHGLSSAKNFLFLGYKEDCVTVDQVHQKQGDNFEKWCKIFTLVAMNVKHTLQVVIDSPFVNKEDITVDSC